MEYRAIEYTSQFDEAMGHTQARPVVGDTVLTSNQADDREWNALKRVLKADSLDLSWDCYDADTGIDTYLVIKA